MPACLIFSTGQRQAVVDPIRSVSLAQSGRSKVSADYFAATIPRGFHVPSPAGKIEGGVPLGQYRRITK